MKTSLFSLKVTIPEDLLTVKKEVGVELETTEPSSIGTSVLFTHPAMRKAILIMWINWIVTTLGKDLTSHDIVKKLSVISDQYVNNQFQGIMGLV